VDALAPNGDEGRG